MEAILKLYGDIGASPNNEMELLLGAEETISAKYVSDFLDENKKAKKLTVKINSRGGDVQEGWAIYDLLTNSGKKIKTIGEGKVYSIATIVFLAGSEREIMKNADGLIHNPFIPEYTLADKYESDDLVKIAEALQQEEAKILEFYAEKTGTEESKLAEYMKEETKLSAEDMVELGFATKVIEPVKAYAYLKLKTVNIMDEKALFEKFGEKLDTLLAKVKNISRVDPSNLVLTDKDGKELTMEKESGNPAVGDKATPDGTFVMENGKTIIVLDGAITEINEETDELEDLKKENADLKAQNEAYEKEKADLATAQAKLKESETKVEETRVEVQNLATELSKLKNSWKPDTRTKGSSLDNSGVDLERVKELKMKLKNAKTE